MLHELESVVATLREPCPSRLDIDRLARGLDVQVTRRNIGEALLGLTLDGDRILLHRELRGARLLLVFAHELAHVLRRRGHFCGVTSNDEEWFADWFARELVLPRRWLTDRWPSTNLGSLHVDAETVALQVSALGAGPSLMRNGRRVLCRSCGTDAHDWRCPCRSWRRGDRDIRALPDIRQMGLLYKPRCWRDAWLSIDDRPAVETATSPTPQPLTPWQTPHGAAAAVA